MKIFKISLLGCLFVVGFLFNACTEQFQTEELLVETNQDFDTQGKKVPYMHIVSIEESCNQLGPRALITVEDTQWYYWVHLDVYSEDGSTFIGRWSVWNYNLNPSVTKAIGPPGDLKDCSILEPGQTYRIVANSNNVNPAPDQWIWGPWPIFNHEDTIFTEKDCPCTG